MGHITLNRSITVTALASFLALGTHSAFAEPITDHAANASGAAPTTVSASSQSGTHVAITAPARAVHMHRAARIPGTFSVAGNDGSRADAQSQAVDRVLLPPLSGDGGG
jgi:hypothetical protein